MGDHLSRGTKFDGDRLSRGTKFVGDHFSRETKFCPWGQEVRDQKYGDQMGSGPNESHSKRIEISKFTRKRVTILMNYSKVGTKTIFKELNTF